MPTNHREDEEIESNELDLEIEPVYDDEGIDYSDERVMDFDDDVEDIDLDSLVALEGPDYF
ncbi:MAG: hypothetical protein JO257_24420 [Deltaproteobacteria bacterium]|nr:hypothetical protein [Deltaproteobacteria bacterium]